MATYYKLNAYGETYNVRPVRSHYIDNNSIAVMLIEDTGEEFAVITVNIADTDFLGDETHAFIDTNNCPWAIDFLTDNNIATAEGYYGISGYCTYPLFTFNLDLIPAI